MLVHLLNVSVFSDRKAKKMLINWTFNLGFFLSFYKGAKELEGPEVRRHPEFGDGFSFPVSTRLVPFPS